MVNITPEMATSGARALRDSVGDINQVDRAKKVFKAMIETARDQMTLTEEEIERITEKGAID